MQLFVSVSNARNELYPIQIPPEQSTKHVRNKVKVAPWGIVRCDNAVHGSRIVQLLVIIILVVHSIQGIFLIPEMNAEQAAKRHGPGNYK